MVAGVDSLLFAPYVYIARRSVYVYHARIGLQCPSAYLVYPVCYYTSVVFSCLSSHLVPQPSLDYLKQKTTMLNMEKRHHEDVYLAGTPLTTLGKLLSGHTAETIAILKMRNKKKDFKMLFFV